MPVVQVEAQLSTDKLLDAIDQMSLSEMEQFMAQALVLQAQRKAPSISQTESELLMKIGEGLSTDVKARFQELVERRQAEALTPEEHQELLCLTEQLETAEAARAEALAKLAILRGMSLSDLMRDLGIPAPDYA